MEFLRKFIKEGYLKAVGKMEDYRIILGAGAYFEKGLLKEEDLIEIYEAIKNKPAPEPVVEEEEKVTEEVDGEEEEEVATEEVTEEENTEENTVQVEEENTVQVENVNTEEIVEE